MPTDDEAERIKASGALLPEFFRREMEAATERYEQLASAIKKEAAGSLHDRLERIMAHGPQTDDEMRFVVPPDFADALDTNPGYRDWLGVRRVEDLEVPANLAGPYIDFTVTRDDE